MTMRPIGITTRADIREGLICFINFTVSIRFVRLYIEIITRKPQFMERCILVSQFFFFSLSKEPGTLKGAELVLKFWGEN